MVALGCLSGVMASLPPKSLNIQEVDVMTTFYCDRLEDEVSTKENVMGLTALQDMSGFGEEEVTKVCNAYDSETAFVNGRLFKDVSMEKHLQATRMAIFTLIDRMATKQRKCTALSAMEGN
jgi:Dos2-interacting transcription regulator of RNA-Pol-II